VLEIQDLAIFVCLDASCESGVLGSIGHIVFVAKGEFPYHKIGKIPPLIGISPLLVLKRVLPLQQNKKKLFHR
jgi:hypothetical protein